MTPTLDELLNGKRGRSKGCPRCGNATDAVVALSLRRIDEGRVTGKSGTTTARTLSLCALHAVELFSQVADVVESWRSGDDA